MDRIKSSEVHGFVGLFQYSRADSIDNNTFGLLFDFDRVQFSVSKCLVSTAAN